MYGVKIFFATGDHISQESEQPLCKEEIIGDRISFLSDDSIFMGGSVQNRRRKDVMWG